MSACVPLGMLVRGVTAMHQATGVILMSRTVAAMRRVPQMPSVTPWAGVPACLDSLAGHVTSAALAIMTSPAVLPATVTLPATWASPAAMRESVSVRTTMAEQSVTCAVKDFTTFPSVKVGSDDIQ